MAACMVVQCCSCRRIEVDGDWRDVAPPESDRVTHTYCPECALLWRLELFAEQASRSQAGSVQAVADLLPV